MKRIIIHIPFSPNPNHPSGTNLRPLKMIDAFKSIGCEVDVVMGFGKARKKSIKQIKTNINRGVKYDLMYSESSTIPTLLTEKNHLPLYPFLDFNFFSFCKKNGIRIALFYRDIYWNFEDYKLNGLKSKITKAFYKYDLKKYNDLVDILYLPSLEMKKSIPGELDCRIEQLPPGFDHSVSSIRKQRGSKISLFYVGGLSSHYQLEKLFAAVNSLSFIHLTICTRKTEWDTVKQSTYSKYKDSPNILVVHKQGPDLQQLYDEADIALIFVEPLAYWEFAVPIKMFEYLGHSKPIISSEGTFAGNFVSKNNLGWTIPYDTEALTELLEHLNEYSHEIDIKQEHVQETRLNHTWEARARQVLEQINGLSI